MKLRAEQYEKTNHHNGTCGMSGRAQIENWKNRFLNWCILLVAFEEAKERRRRELLKKWSPDQDSIWVPQHCYRLRSATFSHGKFKVPYEAKITLSTSQYPFQVRHWSLQKWRVSGYLPLVMSQKELLPQRYFTWFSVHTPTQARQSDKTFVLVGS